MARPNFDATQSASAKQFDKQSDRYGKSHILADVSDVEDLLSGVASRPGATALDIATGGGHTALALARMGWAVTAGDVSKKMLENAKSLVTEAGFPLETQLFAAEQIPYPDHSFDIVSSRVAPHHFSSPPQFVSEVARVLKRGGLFLLIDGSVPDNDPETERWLHEVEKWRDPSHGRFLSRSAWEKLVAGSGLRILRSSLHPKKQPDLNWYFETAATTPENRAKVLAAIGSIPAHVKTALKLEKDGETIVWEWPMLRLLAQKL